jgi:cytochrome c peroxidase
MKFKRKFMKRAIPVLSILMIVAMLTFAIPTPVSAALPLIDPNAVRAAVRQMGMDTLSSVIVTDPAGINAIERPTPPPLTGDPATNPPTPAVPASLQAYATAHGVTIQRAAMQILGKALFWDQQAGSDGQACASCHFSAGSDNRTINTLNPGTRNTNTADQSLFGATGSGGTGAPNYQLQTSDWPFHKMADPFETNYMKRDVLFDTDDPVGSIGTFHATYAGSPAPNYTLPFAQGTFDTPAAAVIDPVFHVGNQNTRSNGPRQAAPTINALFNFNQFWDGRADNTFNGLNMNGAKDQAPYIYFNGGSTLVYDIIAGFGDGSLASQSVAPINSATSDEMAFAGRTLPDVGRKLFRLTGPGTGATATPVMTADPAVAGTFTVTGITVTNQGTGYIHGATVSIVGGGGAGATAAVATNAAGNVTAITVTAPGAGFITPPVVTIVSTGLDTAAYTSYTDAVVPAIIPLGAQQVSSTDSVLGTFVNTAGTNGGRGINLSYVNLIQWAFLPTFWDATGPLDVNGLATMLQTPAGFHLMESNFPLFWGTSIQMYETLLRADQTPYDKFMAGDNSAFDPIGGPSSKKSQDTLRGLLTYIHTENFAQQVDPSFNNLNFGACQLCHSNRELTEASVTNVPLKLFVTTDMTVKMDHNRELAIVASSANFDVGFTNIGSRPIHNDVGIGGQAAGLPGTYLSITKGILSNQAWALLFLPAGIAWPAEPNLHRGSNIDGAFKIPSLRNIEMSGPYFHHGGELTLKQTVDFYARHEDFADQNDPNMDVGSNMVVNIGDSDSDLLVNFLLSLTDDRVRWEQAPFDHPQLFIPNGHPASGSHPVLGASYLPDNYVTLPAVGSAGRQALGLPALGNFMGVTDRPGEVHYIAVTPGTNYTSAPAVTIAAPPVGGSQATAVAFLSGTTVGGILITYPGSGYDPLNPPVVTLTGGGGTGAAATAYTADGAIDFISVNNGGSYTTTQFNALTVTISAPPTGGVQATAVPVKAAAGTGPITSIRITNPGSGYTTLPTVTFSSGAATATARVAAPNGVTHFTP